MTLRKLPGRLNAGSQTFRKAACLFFILIIGISLFSEGALAFPAPVSDRGVTIDMLNQDPDPVKPGETLEIRLSVQNADNDELKNCVVKLEPDHPFEAIEGEKLVENVGTLGKYYSDERSKVVKFKIRVKDDINEGKYPLTVRLSGTRNKRSFSISKDLTIAIESESNAEIEFISLDKLAPGKKTDLTFGIKNVGNSPLKNAMFSWECENDVILPVGSSNVRHVNYIDIGDTANITFNVLTNVNTLPGLYKLDMVLTYDDIEELQTITDSGLLDNQKRKEIKSKAGIYIGGTTDFDVSYMERSLTGAYTFSISNIGNNKANSVKVSIPLQGNWTVPDGSNSVVLGNLQKGDYTYADFNLEPEAYGEEYPLKFEVSYTSSDGQRQTDEMVIPLYAMKFTPPTENPGNAYPSSSSTSSFKYKYVVLVIVGIAAAVAYKKFYKKRKMNE